MLKQGREIKIDISDLFKTSYGTVDVTKLKSIFLNVSSWVEPINESSNWSVPVNRIKSKIKKSLHNQLVSTPFKDKAIIDLDLRTSGIRKGKRSFMRCEVTLFLDSKRKIDLRSLEMSHSINKITNNIIKESLLSSQTFKFYNSKK
tara:strand:- start:278 stop:715 length:438 start_codon:yes stop_codon:yes gene_type:complete